MTVQNEINFDDVGTIRVAFGNRLLVDVREAAAILSIGRSTLYELIGAGDIEVVHIGRACRVPVDGLVRFVERIRRSDAPAATVVPPR